MDGALPDWGSAVAVVGTRSADEDACRFTRALTRALASEGCVVVSGGARGIDTAAHLGALDGGAPTVAVLAGGLDQPTPKSNLGLFAQVAAAGALLSEHAPGTPPWPAAFLHRNRLIAALARAIVVVQAPLRSGALSTAAHGRRLGRPVFVVPAAPWDPRGRGNIRLLKDGALPCGSASDVLGALRWSPGPAPAAGPVRRRQPPLLPRPPAERRPPPGPDPGDGPTRAVGGSPADAGKVLGVLAARPLHPDEIGLQTGLSAGRVQQLLLELELLGAVEGRPGGRYVRA